MTFLPFADRACAPSWAALTRSLRPRTEDIAAVFVPRAVPMFARHLEIEWASEIVIAPQPGQTELQASVRWARDVTLEGWPPVYRRLAEYLMPDVAWMRLRFHAPRTVRGLVFDGFVFSGRRWRWFPRPWRTLPTTSLAGWGAD